MSLPYLKPYTHRCPEGPHFSLWLTQSFLTSPFTSLSSFLASFYSGYHAPAKLKCWLFSKHTFSFVSVFSPILFSLPVTLLLSPPVSVNLCCTTNLHNCLPSAGSLHVSGFQQEEESQCASIFQVSACVMLANTPLSKERHG